MNKWRWKYNLNFVFVFFIITLTIGSAFFVSQNVTAEKDNIFLVVEEQNEEIEEGSANINKEVLNFSKYNEVEIYRIVAKNFYSSKSYTSNLVGSLSGGAMGVSMIQQISVLKRIDNINNIAYVSGKTIKSSTLGTNRSSKYFITKDVCKYVNGRESVDLNDVKVESKEEFLKKMKVNPIDLFVKLNKNERLSKGKNDMRWRTNGIGGELSFYIDAQGACRSAMDFCLSYFSTDCKLNPITDKLKVVLSIDKYGFLKKMKYECVFKCDVKLGKPVAIVGDKFQIEDGKMEFTEFFKNYDSNIEIEDIAPDKKLEK